LLIFDTTKAGLWEGGIFKVRGQGRFGNSLQFRSGSIVPINILSVQPNDDPDQEVFDITDLNYTHMIIPEFALFAGMLNTLDADLNPFAGSTRGKGNFLNASFNINPVVFGSAPYKTVGGGFLARPHERVTFTASAVSRSELSGRSPFGNIDDVVASSELYVSHSIMSLPGGQCLGFAHAWRKATSIDFDPRLTLTGPDNDATNDIRFATKDTSFAVYYNFYQYFQVFNCDTTRWSTLSPTQRPKGWGMFLRSGLSDGDPSPLNGISAPASAVIIRSG
jgi:hypothetical protein